MQYTPTLRMPTLHTSTLHADAIYALHARPCTALYVLRQNEQQHVNPRYGAKTGSTAECQLICFKFSTTAKVGMAIKINSDMPAAAGETRALCP
jgi:hypothetical protein